MAYQLVADIGGTNARFAICDKGSTILQNVQVFHCAQFESPIEAIDAYLSTIKLSVEAACLAVAGPVDPKEDFVKLTNNTWGFSRNQLAKRFNLNHLSCINDFAAAATATTVVDKNDLFFLSENTQFDRTQQSCILGPGTGLGVAGILPHQTKNLIVSSEGGNRSFSPENELEDHILQFLRAERKVVSCETLLSGAGLVNIYRGVCSYHKQTPVHSESASISEAAFENDTMAHATLQAFFEILGSFSGDCALTFGAIGGVYIGGGIAPRFPEALLQSKFRERFENKLHYESYLRKIPVAIVMHSYPGLLGAAAHLKSI